MKLAIILVVSLQLLINSMLGYAHMAMDPHDSCEAIHVHISDGQNLDSDPQEHDGHDESTHIHLCFLVLTPTDNKLRIHPASKHLSLSATLTSRTLTPPVPPPNA